MGAIGISHTTKRGDEGGMAETITWAIAISIIGFKTGGLYIFLVHHAFHDSLLYYFKFSHTEVTLYFKIDAFRLA